MIFFETFWDWARRCLKVGREVFAEYMSPVKEDETSVVPQYGFSKNISSLLDTAVRHKLPELRIRIRDLGRPIWMRIIDAGSGGKNFITSAAGRGQLTSTKQLSMAFVEGF